MSLICGLLGSETAREASPGWKRFGRDRRITLRGFRLRSCITARSARQIESLVEWFADLLKQGLLTRPFLYVMRLNMGTSEHDISGAKEIELKVEGAVGTTHKTLWNAVR